MKHRFWLAAVSMLTAFLASCAGAMANEYYVVEQNEAVYLAWTQDNVGHLQGQVVAVSIDPNNNTRLKTTNASFTGTRSGSDVSLTFGMFSAFGGATWTGHVSFGRLTLIIPTNGVPQQLLLSAGSFANFQQAVSRMQGSVATNQYRVALYNSATESANHLKAGSNSIADGLKRLRAMFAKSESSDSLRDKYAQEWQKMLGVWYKEQAEAQVSPMTCYQKSQVEYQASQVDYELSQFEYLDSQVSYAKSQYDDAVRDVLSGISELQTWAPAFNVRTRAYLASVGQSYNHNAVAATAPMISSAKKSLGYFGGRWADFAAYAKRYDVRAKQQDDEAKAFPKSITCSD